MIMDAITFLFLVGRIIYGGYFAWSGLGHFMKYGMLSGYAGSKGVPLPGFSVFISGLLLLLGGLGILLGVYPVWSVVFLAIFLVPVSFKMHNFWAVTDPNARMGEVINFTKNMALLGAALMFLAIPAPWPYAAF